LVFVAYLFKGLSQEKARKKYPKREKEYGKKALSYGIEAVLLYSSDYSRKEDLE
jgi:hypothetical protein